MQRIWFLFLFSIKTKNQSGTEQGLKYYYPVAAYIYAKQKKQNMSEVVVTSNSKDYWYDF